MLVRQRNANFLLLSKDTNLPLVLVNLVDLKESKTFPLRLSEGSYVALYELGLCE